MEQKPGLKNQQIIPQQNDPNFSITENSIAL
jgi:hypothetical protein